MKGKHGKDKNVNKNAEKFRTKAKRVTKLTRIRSDWHHFLLGVAKERQKTLSKLLDVVFEEFFTKNVLRQKPSKPPKPPVILDTYNQESATPIAGQLVKRDDCREE